MKPRSVRVTSLDVAALAGVSQSAVSRAFTPGSSISPAKRELILTAARKLKYVPNSIASSLTTRRTNMVAVMLGNLENPFYFLVLKTLIDRLQARGTQILTFAIPKDGNSDDVLMRVLRYQVDGIIVTSAQLSMRMTSLCHDRGIPVVLFNRYIPGSDASGVRCDNIAGGSVMADAMLQAGARSFAVIKGDPKGTTSQDRVQGFAERLMEDGVPRNCILELDGHSIYDGGYAAVLRAFRDEGHRIPNAIFAVNDAMAMGAMDAMRGEMGLDVPKDVMFGGFDGIDEAARWPYRLTTILQPVDLMTDETLKLLDLDTPHTEIEPGIDIKVPGQLVWRDTIPRPA